MALTFLLLGSACNRTARVATTSKTNTLAVTSSSVLEARPPVDFATQVKPILQARCQPCHFSGGKVYDRMPFDRPETIKTLGAKLFTRLKDEKEQQLIKDFLAQR